MCSSPIGGGGGINMGDFSAYLDGVGEPDTPANVAPTTPNQMPKDTLDLSAEATAEPTAAVPYEAAAGKPDLAPTVKLTPPGNNPPELTSPEDQKSAEFSKQLAQLPPDLRQKLLKDMAKPESERDPQLAALETTMNTTASTAAWGKSVQENPPQSPPAPKTPTDAAKPLEAATTAGVSGAQAAASPYSPSPINGIMPAKLDPTTMTDAQQATQMTVNGVQVLKNSARVTEAQVNALPASDPQHPTLSEFLKFITKAIGDIQKLLGTLSSADAKRAAKAVMGQKAVMEAKMEKAMEALEKAKTMQKIAKVIETVMKVLGPLLAVVCLVLAIVSGGTLAIVLAVVMLVIALLASFTHIIDDAMKKVMTEIQNVFKAMGMSDDDAMIMTMVVMVVLMIVLMVVTKGAVAEEGAQMAGMAGKEAAATATSEVAAQASATAAKTETSALSQTVSKMLAGQVGMVVIGHNDVIDKGMKPLLKKMGFDEKTAGMIAMLVQMLTMLMVGIYASGGISGMGNVAKEAALAGDKAVENIVKTLEKLTTAVEVLVGATVAIGKLYSAKLTLEKAKMDSEGKGLDMLMKLYGMDQKKRNESMQQLVELSNSYGQLLSTILNTRDKILDATMAA